MSRRAVAAGLVGAALVVALTGCRASSAGSAQPQFSQSQQTGSSAALSLASPSNAGAAPTLAGAQQSAALAAVSSDLAGIDAGNSQADRDLSAGDSARAQNDNN